MGCGCDNPAAGDQPVVDLQSLTMVERARGNPVLGPSLGGGVVGSGLNESFSLPVPGGGMTPAITHVASPPPHYPQTRQDFHFDYSTVLDQPNAPQRDGNVDTWRQLGGLT